MHLYISIFQLLGTVTFVTLALEMVLLQVTKDLQMKKHNLQNCRKKDTRNTFFAEFNAS